MSKPIFVSFYTPTYKDEVYKLERSLKFYKLEYLIFDVKCRGSWDANTKIKVEIIKFVLSSYKRPVVYVDVDAVVQSNPILFDDFKCDIAYHKKNNIEVLSGTLYFGHTDAAIQILEAWDKENKVHPKVWDQRNLASVLNKVDHVAELLPAAYCQIFDSMRGPEPVIEHFQASRRLKRKV